MAMIATTNRLHQRTTFVYQRGPRLSNRLSYRQLTVTRFETWSARGGGVSRLTTMAAIMHTPQLIPAWFEYGSSHRG